MSRSTLNLQAQEREKEQQQLPIRGPTWSNASIRRGSDVVEMSEESIKQIEAAEGMKDDTSFSKNLSTSLSNIMSGVLSSLHEECAEEAKLHPMKKEQIAALELNRQTVKKLLHAANNDDEFHKIQEAIREKGVRTGISTKAFLFAKGA